MLGPKVRPQIHDLPRPQPNQDPRSRDAKPLNTVVGALIGITQLLFPMAQIVHVAHNLLHLLLNVAQFRLKRLQLLRGLDGTPVLGVGADIDVELDVARGRVRSTVLCE